MPKQVVNGAMMACTFGLAPSSLTVLPTNDVTCDGVPAANIMDHKPIANIAPFGMCNSISNPTVAAATAAALGVLTPTPCVPATSSPWSPGSSTVLIGDQPALNSISKCNCQWAGVISITNPGQATTDTP